MLNFKHWNISRKLGFVFILIIALVGINFMSVNYYHSFDQLEHDFLLQKTAENPLLVEKIKSINTLFIFKGDTSNINRFQTLIRQHQQNLDIFKNGGEVEYLDRTIDCEPIGIIPTANIARVENYWNEFKVHLKRVIDNEQFIISIGQYRRWDAQLNHLLKTQLISKEANLALYKLQSQIDLYLQKDVSGKGEVLKQLAYLDTYIKTLNDKESSQLKQVWSSISFHIKFLLNRSQPLASSHFIEANAEYLINLEILYKDKIQEYLLKQKVTNYWNLLIIVAIIVLLNIFIIAFGFNLIKQFVIEPIESLSNIAKSISSGDTQEFFEKRYNDEIGKTVEQLNVMLQSLKVSKMEKDLMEKSLQFKTDFLSSMSHEIRTPLTGIIGMADVLSQSDNLTNDQLYYIETLKNSSHSLLGILNDVLDLSRIEAGKMHIQPDIVSIERLVSEVVSLFEAKASEVNVEVSYVLAEDVPNYIYLDELRVKQILSNLLGNALKFSSELEVIITVEIEETSAEHIYYRFEVIDSGVGISEADQAQLFNQFSQTKSGISVKEGSGLGLSICKQLVALMGGEIGVVSELNVGSTFWFTIKTDKLSKEEVELKKNTQENNDLEIEPLNAHILVVEDMQVSQTVIGLMLDKLQCTYDFANDGQIALDIYQDGRYDLILMDIKMPVLNGFECAVKLREEFNGVPPIIGLSANVLASAKQQSENTGMDAYLHKPLIFENFYTKLKEILNT